MPISVSNGQIIVFLDRSMVESGDIDSVLESLAVFSATPESTRAHAHELSLIFDGYQHDRRELYQIPEVRRFVRALNGYWPYWFHFVNKADHNLLVLMYCLMELEGTKVKDGIASTTLVDGEFCRVIGDLFGGMNHLYARHEFTKEENRAATREIKDYLESLNTSPV
jgi:hypothetical protein